MKKAVIIINGTGGVGKDTTVQVVTNRYGGMNVSSVDVPKQLLQLAGWDGEKTPQARKALSEIKKTLTAFNDRPFTWCVEQLEVFQQLEDCPFMFVHIRERENIDKFHNYVSDNAHLPCYECLVVGNYTEWGNPSDDLPANFRQQDYDIVLYNTHTLEDLKDAAIGVFDRLYNELKGESQQ